MHGAGGKTEDMLWELLLPFDPVDSGEETQVLTLGTENCYLVGHLADPFFKNTFGFFGM